MSEISFAAINPGFAPIEIATGLCTQQVPQGIFQLFPDLWVGLVALARLPLGVVYGFAQRGQLRQRILLFLGSGPLQKTVAIVPAGVPGAGVDLDFTDSAMLV